MIVDPNLTLLSQELRRDEGVRPSAYQDSLGYWTIGVGRLIDAGRGGRLSDSEIEVLLQNDIAQCIHDLGTLPAFVNCNTPRRCRSLLNIRFQLGLAGLRTFTTFLSLMEQQKYKEAAADLRTTKWYKQVPARAERICKMIEEG